MDKTTDSQQNRVSEINQKAQKLGVAYLEEAPLKINKEVLDLISREIAQQFKVIAFEKIDNVIKVAAVNPKDVNVLNTLRFLSEQRGLEIEEFLVSEEVFGQFMKFYSNPDSAEQIMSEASRSIKDSSIENQVAGGLFGSDSVSKQQKVEEVLKDKPIAKLVEVIISHAIEGKASDIHIEPMFKDYRARFRVDGILHVSLTIPREIGPAVISRIKILSNLRIEEKRKPQDGRFRINFNGHAVDFRVSTLPVIEGEKVVMRILDKEEGLAQIELLGLLGLAADNIKKAIQETYGMILLTGPTGSGKSTTSYAMLKILNQEERNIVTLEDPIEYNIEGLNQSQIKPEIGYTFANGLRTILRQDPNVIMVGEIRDSETAELAVHAALTGHLLFSTLHTNTAIGAMPRLIDMGIEPFLLSSALRLVVAQRLVRKICEGCKEEKTVPEKVRGRIMEIIKNISEKETAQYGLDLKNGVKFYHGKGCDACNGTGLKGRIAIYEVVPINEEIKSIIVEKNSNEKLIEQERDKMGIITIEQDGVLKALSGITTLEEVERVTEANITLEEENF